MLELISHYLSFILCSYVIHNNPWSQTYVQRMATAEKVMLSKDEYWGHRTELVQVDQLIAAHSSRTNQKNNIVATGSREWLKGTKKCKRAWSRWCQSSWPMTNTTIVLRLCLTTISIYGKISPLVLPWCSFVTRFKLTYEAIFFFPFVRVHVLVKGRPFYMLLRGSFATVSMYL